MSFTVRCFSCGKVIDNLWTKYLRYVREEEDKDTEQKIDAPRVDPRARALNRLNIDKYCCRTIFLTYIDTHTQAVNYSYLCKQQFPLTRRAACTSASSTPLDAAMEDDPSKTTPSESTAKRAGPASQAPTVLAKEQVSEGLGR